MMFFLIKTGHAEAIQIEYIQRRFHMKIYLSILVHSQSNYTEQQGPDIGSQYRSMIAYHTPEQERSHETQKNPLRNLDD